MRHGARAQAYELAHVLGRTVNEVQVFRGRGVCDDVERGKSFPELFMLWHGRAPIDADWPAHRAQYRNGCYEWQERELTLLVSLVGRSSVPEIAALLTERLRKLTGDPAAVRSVNTVRMRINGVGMQAGDLVGGLTVQEAAQEIDSMATVYSAIAAGELQSQRVGHRLVIPRAAWTAFKTSRALPPAGFVPLASLREQLGIRSDAKLPEFAKSGLVPTAVLCRPFGSENRSGRGSWFIAPDVAKKLVADRHAGKPMPWHGKPNLHNLQVTWRLLQERVHPVECETCAAIWGAEGPPTSFEDYAKRYPPLAFGAKRHLTRVFTPGLTLAAVAKLAKRPLSEVRRAVVQGALKAHDFRGSQHVTQTDATRWITRKCPTGDGGRSWLSVEAACRQYCFTATEMQAKIRSGELKSKVGTDGAMRGICYVLRQQCAELREREGFTEQQAAKRLRISVPRLQRFLKGVDWRPSPKIPLVTLQAVQKRLASREGFDLADAARIVRKPIEWVEARIADGTVRVARAPWDRRRKYLTKPQLARLEAALEAPEPLPPPPADSLTLDQAARESKVSRTTLMRWVEAGELERIETSGGWRYPRAGLRARATEYWRTARFVRPVAPTWTQQGGQHA
ncbi:helix-turn-helix domain-containing protein [Ramlibacter sp.]|uniref:helix-turn-helix domain-containing protein n=1 Tax=Ramlibacter sp. TaxID=1917967 RepID=UPI003D0A1BE4